MRLSDIYSVLGTVVAILLTSFPTYGATPVVPGTGTHIFYVGDNFEDEKWGFKHNFPKSSRENDERARSPMGRSLNGRWVEGPERGQPDDMQVVATPPGGLSGSQFSLRIRTLNSGIPGRINYGTEQDDLIMNSINRIGSIPVSEIPNCVVRIFLPPADQWENRSGPHFGIRVALSTKVHDYEDDNRFRLFSQKVTKWEPYWPGMWVHFRSKTTKTVAEDSALIKVRGNHRGHDFKAKEIPIEQFGWWTFGMSVTVDGQVHYYASPGVDNLTTNDYITSQYPYSFQALNFRTFFFNSCNRNDGQSWSTPFIIDDPQLFVVQAQRIESLVARKINRNKRSATKKSNSTRTKR